MSARRTTRPVYARGSLSLGTFFCFGGLIFRLCVTFLSIYRIYLFICVGRSSFLPSVVMMDTSGQENQRVRETVVLCASLSSYVAFALLVKSWRLRCSECSFFLFTSAFSRLRLCCAPTPAGFTGTQRRKTCVLSATVI